MFDRRLFTNSDVFGFELQLIQDEISYLDDFIRETEKSITNKRKDLELEYKEALAENPADEDLDYRFQDEYYKHTEIFLAFSYNSILVSQFSFFESRLKSICALYNSRLRSNVEWKDFAGSEMEKFKKYLKVAIGIKVEDLNLTLWNKIKEIQDLRNLIVHESARISIKREEIIKRIKSEDRIEYNESSGAFYIKEGSYLLEVNATLKDYLLIVLDQFSKNKVLARNTKMPYDNGDWGKEKTESVLKSISETFDNLKQIDMSNENELANNLVNTLKSITWDVTKLYAFFCDGQWDTKDKDTIIEKGMEGFNHVKRIYNKK